MLHTTMNPPFKKHLNSIRSRLFASLVLMAVLPAAAFSAVSGFVGISKGKEQAINQLESISRLKESELNTWVTEMQNLLTALTIENRTKEDLCEVLSTDIERVTTLESYYRLHEYFTQIYKKTSRFEELFLVNPRRIVVFSTNLVREGKMDDPDSQIYLREGLKGDFVNPPAYGLSEEKSTIVVVHPIHDIDGNAIGILAGRVSTTIMVDIMQDRTGLGQTGETYLVMDNYLPLTTLLFPGVKHRLFTEATQITIEKKVNGSGVYRNYQGIEVIGVYHWLPKLQVALIAEQHKSEALDVTYTTLSMYVAVVMVAIVIAGLVSFLLGQSIVTPLSQLVGWVGQMGRQKKETIPLMEREDEIGILAQAFADKDNQLSSLICKLDQEVQERTKALGQRAVQLETIAQISRGITSILDIDDLLQRVVDLIRISFNYYYVGIFLIDRESNQLVFQVGTENLQNQFKEKKIAFSINSESLNGLAALSGEPLIVNDTLNNPSFFQLDLLAETRSELVVPLKVGDRVIGTLDVQSVEKDSFDSEIIQVMQSLSAQVAIAIENANLYSHNRAIAVVEERTRLARELHDSVTQSLYTLILFSGAGQEQAQKGDLEGILRHLIRIEEVAKQALKEMRLLLFELRSPMLDAKGLTGALKQRLEAVEKRSGITTQLVIADDLHLPLSIEEDFYRIAQEALNNALKHAKAQTVVVRVLKQDNTAILEVCDDGIGFDCQVARERGGMGLTGMQERAESLNGCMIITSTPGKGTCVRVIVSSLCQDDSNMAEEVGG